MESAWEDAREAEEQGNLARAATNYVTIATYKLANSDYEPGAEYRKGIAFALRAISLDAQAGNTNRAERHLMLFERAFERMAESEDHDMARGFAYEWLGDARLMVSMFDACIEAYEQASNCYTRSGKSAPTTSSSATTRTATARSCSGCSTGWSSKRTTQSTTRRGSPQ
jgi:tetratricopeptide (TPR) repeat protein